MRLKFSRAGKTALSKSYTLSILDSEGKSILDQPLPVAVKSGESIIEDIELPPAKEGLYRVNLSISGQQVKSFEIVVINDAALHAKQPSIPSGSVADMTLLETIDCSKNYKSERYRDDREVSVQKMDIGPYREAQNMACSGFAYRIQPLKNPGRPHWLEITYPDNAERTFMVAVFQEKDGHIDAKGLDTMGIITGGDHPITGKMQVRRLLFWPDSKNIMVGCYAYKKYDGQAGPALSTIRIFENKGPLPKRRVDTMEGVPTRAIGVWQEDPSMTAYGWFTQDTLYDNVTLNDFWKNKWERIVAYLDYSGQNLWNMMVTDYDGDTGLNSNQIASAPNLSRSGRVPGWADLGALMLNRKDVVFYASINNRVPNQKHMGAIYKMIPKENHRTYGDMREILAGDRLIADAIGANDNYTGSYNPLNPVVQAAYKQQVRLYAEKFGRYENFGGVHFITMTTSSLYFHNLREGYGDYTTKLFEKETGISIPVKDSVRRRFSQRHAWIMAHAKDEWIQWRCQKIRTFYKELASEIQKYNPSAKLLISMRVTAGFSNEGFKSETALADYWRECGVDFDLFKDDADIVLMQAITPHRGRIYGHRISGLEGDRYNGFDPQVGGLVSNHTERSAFISYHSNLEFLPYDKQRIPDYWVPFGSWHGRVNGPIHAFANVVPSRKFILEYMTNILAHNDAKRIIHGWWGCPDNGAIDEFSRFYASYRSIPAYDFLDLPHAEDPVKVRYYNTEDSGYVYFVNQLPHPVQCTLTLEGISELSSTLDGQRFVLKDGTLKLILKPYQVLCLSAPSALHPRAFNARVPTQVIEQMKKQFESLTTTIKAGRGTHEGDVSTLEAVYSKIKKAFDFGHYAEFSHLLQSAPIRKTGWQP